MIHEIKANLEPKLNQLLQHPLYRQLNSPEQLQVFMEHHVFAVWDNMSLLKALQLEFTRTKNPWIPVGDPELRYLVNKLILVEETDLNSKGEHQSHFEMYLDAMIETGASTQKIRDFLLHVNHGTDIFLIIAASKLPISIKQFVKNTFDVVSEAKPHKIAAAFCFGRENLVPEIFHQLLKELKSELPREKIKLFEYYLRRQKELKKEYQPHAFKMLEILCGNEAEKWEEVNTTAQKAIDTRINLWNGIAREINKNLSVQKTG